MNERDWELLLTLYEEGTITNTAQKLYISQPALTYRIKQIEKELNTKIMFRGNKGVVFTSEGEYLINYSKKMVNEMQNVKDNLKDMQNNVQGTLRIGVSSNFALYKLPLLLQGFLSEYPNVEINLTTGWSTNILNKLKSKEVHVAILRGDHNWIEDQILLNRETLCVASKKEINISDLPNLNLIRYQTDHHIKNTFDQWWQNMFNKPPNITMEVDRIETCKELVKRGLGYAFFPSISLNKEDGLHTIDLKQNNNKIFRETWLLYRKELIDLKVNHAFVTFTKKFYQI